jgi:hypothetical protein
MPSNFKSPYTPGFNSAIKRGTPCFVAVQNIAKTKGTTPKVIFNSLWKAGIVNRVKFNGEWVYWPAPETNFKKGITKAKNSQTHAWQHFVDWFVFSGYGNPQQLFNHKGSQKEFMSWCRKYWNKQFTPSTPSKSKSRSPRKTKSGNYRFSTAKSRTTRRYRKAA